MTHVVTDFGNITVYDKSAKLLPEVHGENFHRIKEKYFAYIDSIPEKGDEKKPFIEVFREVYPNLPDDWPQLYFLENLVNFDYGDENKLSSLLFNEGEDFGEEEALITNGYSRLAHYLAKGIKVNLQCRVSRIDYTTNRVFVSHDAGVAEADYAVVTVPLGVLRSRSI